MHSGPDSLITRGNRWLVVKRQKKLKTGQILEKLLKEKAGFDGIVAGELLDQPTRQLRMFARFTGTYQPCTKEISQVVSHPFFLFVQKAVHAGCFGVGA